MELIKDLGKNKIIVGAYHSSLVIFLLFCFFFAELNTTVIKILERINWGLGFMQGVLLIGSLFFIVLTFITMIGVAKTAISIKMVDSIRELNKYCDETIATLDPSDEELLAILSDICKNTVSDKIKRKSALFAYINYRSLAKENDLFNTNVAASDTVFRLVYCMFPTIAFFNLACINFKLNNMQDYFQIFVILTFIFLNKYMSKITMLIFRFLKHFREVSTK